MKNLLPLFIDINCTTIVILEDNLKKCNNSKAFFKLLSLEDNIAKKIIDYWKDIDIVDTAFIEALKKLNREKEFDFYKDLRNNQNLTDIVEKFADKDLFAFGLNISTSDTDYPFLPLKDKSFEIRGFDSFENYEKFMKNYNEFKKKYNYVEKSALTLFIIDEKLNGAVGGSDAQRMIEEEDFGDARCLTVKFSSDSSNSPDEAKSKKEFGGKSLEQSTITALFRVLLRRIRNQYIKSATEAEKISSSNFKNISYVLKRSESEGCYHFDVVKEWFKHAHSFFLTSAEYDATLHKLATAINNNEIEYSDPLDTNNANKIYKICSHEAFDFGINQHCQPIMLGDIFSIGDAPNEKYYILLGQICDLTLRYNKSENTVSRTTKLAECVEVSIISDTTIGPNKITTNTENNTLVIKLYDFWNESKQQLTTITIRLCANSVCFWSFDLLDCCAFTTDGSATSNFPTKDLNPALLARKNELLEKFSNAAKLISMLEEPKPVGSQESEERLSFLKKSDPSHFWDYFDKRYESPSKYNFNIKRLARVHEDYIDLINRLYHEYKGRVGISTFRFPGTTFQSKLSLKIDNIQILVKHECTFYEDEKDVFLRKDDLLNLIPEDKNEFKKFINNITDNNLLVGKSKNDLYQLIKKDKEYHLEIYFHILYDGKTDAFVSTINIDRIFEGKTLPNITENAHGIKKTASLLRILQKNILVYYGYEISLFGATVKVDHV